MNISHRNSKFLELEPTHQQMLLESLGDDIVWQSLTPELRDKFDHNRLYATAGVRQVIDSQLSQGVHPSRCRNAVGMYFEVDIDRRKKANRRNGDMAEAVAMNYWFFKLGVSNLIKCRADEYMWGVKWTLHPDKKRDPNSPCKICISLDESTWRKDDTSAMLPVLDTHLGCDCFLDTITRMQAKRLGLLTKNRKWWKFW